MARSHPETWLITEKLTLNGQIHGKKVHGRPRTMLLDWLLKTKEGNISYKELKMSAQDRSRRSQWRCKAAIWQNTAETARAIVRERERFLSLLTFSQGPGVAGHHTPTIDPFPCSHTYISPIPLFTFGYSRPPVKYSGYEPEIYYFE